MDYEQIVKQFFEKLGYRVEKIPETRYESPDFWISDDSSVYLLELKTKFPSVAQIETRKSQLYSGSIHNVHELVVANNTLSGIIKKAKNQLKSFAEENVIRLVWLLIVSTESEARLLLNPLSPRFEEIKSSSLPKHLGTAVVDPIELEKIGKAFLVDGEVDRGDKEAVLQYLRKKYRSEDLMNLTMTYLSGTMAFPDEVPDKDA